MTKELSQKILVERIGFAFFVDIEYEKLPELCNFCSCIGHSFLNCKRKEVKKDQTKDLGEKSNKDTTGPTTKVLDIKKLVEIHDDNVVKKLPDVNGQTMGETSNKHRVQNHGTNNSMEGTIVVRTSNNSTKEQEGKSDSDYVDATPIEEYVHETQIHPAHKE